MKRLLVLPFVLFSMLAYPQDSPRSLYVLATNGLNLRAQPEVNARILTHVAYGKQVEVLEKTKVMLESGWIRDHWYRVRYRGREGFVYGAYLSAWKPPQSDVLLPLPQALADYAAFSFVPKNAPTHAIEVDVKGDTSRYTLVQFNNGAELESEENATGLSVTLVLPGTVQQAYVLLEAIMKQQGLQQELSGLRFVKDVDGTLVRVNDRERTIGIQGMTEDRTTLKVRSFR